MSGAAATCTLRIDPATNAIAELVMCKLGVTSIASSVCYLANGFVYIGAEYSDSQLIKLSSETNADNEFIEVVDTYSHIGPICDFVSSTATIKVNRSRYVQRRIQGRQSTRRPQWGRYKYGGAG